MYICDARCVPVNHTPSKTNMCFNLTDLKTELLFLKPRTKKKTKNKQKNKSPTVNMISYSSLN